MVIGPVYPYKGGISHYTGQMIKGLKKKYDVTTVSYKMQYPSFMFKKPQKDYQNKAFEIEDTNYWINTANPFNIIGCISKINKIEADLIIIQWWHPYFTPCYRILTRGLKGTVVFVCHNVIPHERFFMDTFLTKLALKRGRGFILHSEEDRENLEKLLPGRPVRKNVLPTMNAFKMKNITAEEARKMLGIEPNEHVLLFFGFVRKYKGLNYLLKAMPEIVENDSLIKLFVVGDFGSDKDDYLKLVSDETLRSHIIIKDGYTPDEEVEPYFAAADLCVCPYVSATQSAIVQVAFGFNLPVLATNVGGLPEVVTDGQTGYVVESENPAAISDAVADYFANDRKNSFVKYVEAESKRFSWDKMTETVEELYEQCKSVHN